MTRRIRTTKQATRARVTALWVIAESSKGINPMCDEFDIGLVFEHELGRVHAQAVLDMRRKATR